MVKTQLVPLCTFTVMYNLAFMLAAKHAKMHTVACICVHPQLKSAGEYLFRAVEYSAYWKMWPCLAGLHGIPVGSLV